MNDFQQQQADQEPWEHEYAQFVDDCDTEPEDQYNREGDEE